VVVDEVGPLEIGGGGWSGILELLLKETGLMQIWVAREQIVDDIKLKWNIPAENIFRLEKGNKETVMEMIRRRVANQKQ
jgi:nucleoside-triphosphatase THEP1